MKFGIKYFYLIIDLCIFFCQDDFNVIIVVWGKGVMVLNYNQVVLNIWMVGIQFCFIIDMMVRVGGKVSDMYLIGYSFGVYIVGYIG